MNNDLTVIITASYIPSHPSTRFMDSVINSLQLINLPLNTKIILAHDYNDNLHYKKYLEKLKLKYFKNKYIIINVRSSKGHLTGNIRDCFNKKLINTKFLLVLQHDLPFIKKFNIQKIILDMIKFPKLKHIRFNKRNNIKEGFDKRNNIFNYIKLKNNYEYMSTPGWSDQNHLTYKEYYENIVLSECQNGTFMENFLNGKINNLTDHNKYGTFLFGKFNDTATIKHTDGRNTDGRNTDGRNTDGRNTNKKKNNGILVILIIILLSILVVYFVTKHN